MEKETSVTRLQGYTFFSFPRPQVPWEGKQKKPSKIRKDRENNLAAGKQAGVEKYKSLKMQGIEIQLIL